MAKSIISLSNLTETALGENPMLVMVETFAEVKVLDVY